MKIELTPSGVEAIDSSLGGLVADDITLVCGPPRAGKTVLGLNHIVWLLQQNMPVMLATTDLPETLIDMCDRFFEFDVRPAIERKHLTLLTLAPNFANRLRSLGTVARAFEEMGMLCAERSVRHVVFDTIDPVLAAITVTNVKRFIQEALAGVKHMNTTLLCMSRAEGDAALTMGVQELAGRVSTTLEMRPGRLIVRHADWSGMAGSGVNIQLVAGRGVVSTGQASADEIDDANLTTQPPSSSTPTLSPVAGVVAGRWNNQVNTLVADGGAAVLGDAGAARPDPMQQVVFSGGGGGGGG
ncbi:MAG: hypothetical protein KC503_19730, partial [Myxococcales bacterium]|nr:hypothetical protein [Myxococcales bacterium]